MESRLLAQSQRSLVIPDIYADKSALILQWLLVSGIERDDFSLREVAADALVSLGLVQRIFEYLVNEGILVALGLRTAKKFKLLKPKKLLNAWAEHYSLSRKCRIWNYRSSLDGREEILNVLKRSSLWNRTCLALHSAAEFHGCKNTNLTTLELYVLETDFRVQVEQKLELQPQERGYEVLLIKPYYKAMLSSRKGAKLLTSEKLKVPGAHLFYSPALLTYLDLYNFPLRGREQAEFMAQRVSELKRILKKD